MIDLKGTVAVVTGGSRGIGRSVVKQMTGAGAKVVFSYASDMPAARSLVAEVESAGGTAVAVAADLARREEAESIVEDAQTRFGQVDVLVNNAGIWNSRDIPIEEMTDEEWDHMMAVNLKGMFHTIRCAVPMMKERRRGRIVNVASTAGQRGEAFHAHYAATKAAVFGLTKSLAAELAPYGILVNTVAPGWVDTDMSAEPLHGPDRARIDQTIVLRRPGTADEIAGAILFLSSPLCSYMTGATISVNGGSVLCV
jgi:3-oxoacyl-[acyl-carrier protein] reductase